MRFTGKVPCHSKKLAGRIGFEKTGHSRLIDRAPKKCTTLNWPFGRLIESPMKRISWHAQQSCHFLKLLIIMKLGLGRIVLT